MVRDELNLKSREIWESSWLLEKILSLMILDLGRMLWNSKIGVIGVITTVNWVN
jgi:hypothetical protein